MSPTPPLEAAIAILARCHAPPRERRGAFVLAGAAAIAERSRPGTARATAAALGDTPAAAAILTGAALVAPDLRAAVDRVLRALPPEERNGMIGALEAMLAAVDPLWAWSIVSRAAVAPDSIRGLEVAAYAEQAGLSLDCSAGRGPETLFARQLAADRLARAAGRGELDRDAPELARLGGAANLPLPTEAAALFAAAVLTDVRRALSVVDELLEWYAFSDLADALRLLGERARAASLAEEIVSRVTRPGFIADQAEWLHVAAESGCLPASGVAELAASLAPRVIDECDHDRELIAGIPILRALSAVGMATEMARLAAEWRMPPPLFADLVFARNDEDLSRAVPEHGCLETVFAVPSADWCNEFSYDFAWWLDAGDPESNRLVACHHVVALAGHLPWRREPGSLADVIGWLDSPVARDSRPRPRAP